MTIVAAGDLGEVTAAIDHLFFARLRRRILEACRAYRKREQTRSQQSTSHEPTPE
jgi:hypothetical protein